MDAVHTLTLPQGSRSPHSWFFAAGKPGSTHSHQPTHEAQLHHTDPATSTIPTASNPAWWPWDTAPLNPHTHRLGWDTVKGKIRQKEIIFFSPASLDCCPFLGYTLPARPRTAQPGLQGPAWAGGARGVGGQRGTPMLDHSARWDAMGGDVPPGHSLP